MFWRVWLESALALQDGARTSYHGRGLGLAIIPILLRRFCDPTHSHGRVNTEGWILELAAYIIHSERRVENKSPWTGNIISQAELCTADMGQSLVDGSQGDSGSGPP